MITDQGCQTNAPVAKLFMKGNEQLFINNMAVDCGTDRGYCDEYNSFIRKMQRCDQIGYLNGTGERFRVYGEINAERQHCMVLVTEITGFVDDVELWASVEAIQAATEAHLWVMEENPLIDRSLQLGDNGHIVPEGYTGDHLRMERQVELSWRIEQLSYKEIQSLIRSLTVATDPLWPSHGVCVA